ncbi:uncharacterized protein LOC113283219 [Papaver somniferum]|uniref:uncharacterized protein LOC113283219 n=1 Tax=Papaver somniferum TaxID=3469 RepID=UPI000E6FCA18|nr:uncharacterized protein LOC113283219 [Papaver somniferum]
MEYLISIAKSKWESFLPPKSEAEIIDEVVNLESMNKEEEVFVDELVFEFSEKVTPNFVPDATIDSTLDSDSVFGSKTDSDKGLNEFPKSTSNIEDLPTSFSEFTVSPPKEIKSIPTGVVEEEFDKAEVNDFGRTDQTDFGWCCFTWT